jgi:glycosyltransferase involved in cell wall biosynthesis
VSLLRTCIHIVKTAEPECVGVYRVVECIARHVGEFGYTAHVLFLAPGPLEDAARKAGFETSAIAWDGTLRDPAGAWRFWRWMRAHRADVAHFHHGGRSARLLARLAGARAVVRHVHGRVEESGDASIAPMEFRYADAVIACSEAVAEHITGCRPEVIYTGIALQVEVPAAARAGGPLRAGMLARLIPLKQVDAAIEACARLAERGIAMELEIAGAGPCEQDLRALATRRGIGDQVHFLGWRSDVEELLETWEVLVMPSLDEGFPMAALEAMASGRAVVASRTGGLCELIADGETGLLFSAEDVDALTECLAAMAVDRERLAEMGAAGWRRAHEKFTGIEMARSTAAIYDRLLHD